MSRNPEFDILLKRGEERENAFAAILLGPADSVTIEHKSELRSVDFGTVFIEYADDAQGPTGISVTTADWYAIEISADRWVVIRTDDLKQLVRNAADDGRRKRGGWEKRARGVLVPLLWFVARPVIHNESAELVDKPLPPR